MNTQESLIDEIRRQPEPVQLELLRFLRFLVREQSDGSWSDVLPDRQLEQEVLSILDGQASQALIFGRQGMPFGFRGEDQDD